MNFRNKTFVALVAIAALSSVAIAQPALNVKGSNFGGNEATFRSNGSIMGNAGQGISQASFLQAAGFNVVNIPAVDLDWGLGSYFTKTLSGNTTFTFSNVRPGKTVVLAITGASGFGINWPAGVTWDGVTPGAPANGTVAHYEFTGSGGTATRGFVRPQGTMPLPIAKGGTGNTTGAVAAANVTGTLAVANGGTGSATQNFVDLTTAQSIAGNKTFSGTVAAGTVSVPVNGTTITLGATGLSSGFSYLNFNNTPSASNYSVLGDGGQTYLNGASVLYLRTSNTDRATVTSDGISVFSGFPAGALNVGADTNSNLRTTNAGKLASFTSPDYTNAKKVEWLSYSSPASNANVISFGGRTGGSQYAATGINFTTAVDTSTTGGTVRLTIDNNGQTELLNQAATNTTSVMTRALADTRYQPATTLRLTTDVSCAIGNTYVSGGETITLGAGTYAFRWSFVGRTVSTTGGVQFELLPSVTNADTTNAVAIIALTTADGATNTPNLYNRSGANLLQYVVGGNTSGFAATHFNASSTGTGTTVLAGTTTFTPRIKQPSATDAANPALLKAGSYITFEKLN